MREGECVMSVTEARELAVRAHQDQRDRDDSFHINHVARVAEGAPRQDAYQRVAWLHDVIEDSDIDAEQLRLRLPEAELEAIRLLTHDEGMAYQDYIDLIVAADGEAGTLARAIKEADMLDNLRRCALARDEAVEQYGRALVSLWRRG
jgi:(p)ppGpp synthase/HD superfamily hydrolase